MSTRHTTIALALVALVALLRPAPAVACGPTDVTPNTPTGIAGCERWGAGVASHYGPGSGVAMNFCTWEVRHADGCGLVEVRSVDTGLVAVVPVIDFCDCYTGTAAERVIDLQYGVVAALGLDLSRGLYDVTVERASGNNVATEDSLATPALPNTTTDAEQRLTQVLLVVIGILLMMAGGIILLARVRKARR